MNWRRKAILEIADEVILWEGLDNAIIGVVERCGSVCCVYDREGILKELRKDMEEDDAIEYMNFNIVNAYVGQNTPFIMTFLPLAPKRKAPKIPRNEMERLRAALREISNFKDEPYCADFARDVLDGVK
jgi:hypothetical protein